MDLVAGPVTNCLDRSIYGPLAGRAGFACPRCGGYHDANGKPFVGPCPTPGCPYVSLPGGGLSPDCQCVGPTCGEVTHRSKRVCGRKASVTVVQLANDIHWPMCARHAAHYEADVRVLGIDSGWRIDPVASAHKVS